MDVLIRWYRYLNILSIDIVAGAIAGAYFFASLLGVEIRPYAIASLGLTVWIIYTADHLLDAIKIKGKASTARHGFHQENAGKLATLVLIASIIDLVLIFFIKKPVLYGGFLISIFVGLYLIVHRWLSFLKEIVVALLYCAGILLPSLPVTPMSLQTIHYLMIVLFFTTALINLLLFSLFDFSSDLADNRSSFVTLTGEKMTKTVLVMLFCANLILMMYGLATDGNGRYVLVTLAMNALLLAIFTFRKWFNVNDRYRLLGDSIFLLPFLVI